MLKQHVLKYGLVSLRQLVAHTTILVVVKSTKLHLIFTKLLTSFL